MRIIKVILFFVLTLSVSAQEVSLKKGMVMHDLVVNDTLSETFSLYLPTSFTTDKSWPVLFVFDLEGKSRQAINMVVSAAEEQHYIVAASNSVLDTIPLSQNVLISNRMFNKVFSIVPIQKNGIYTAGYRKGAKIANLMPYLIPRITGVLSAGASVANRSFLNAKKPYYFIGIVGKEDFLYSEMLANKKVLDKLKFPNHLLLHNAGEGWPKTNYFSTALEYFTLARMAKNNNKQDSVFVSDSYAKNLLLAPALYAENTPLLAVNTLDQMVDLYGPLLPVDSLKLMRKEIKKSRLYKTKKNEENAALLKESFLVEDYEYYLEEDIRTYNYNNLGWWKYQTEELAKLGKSPKVADQQSGKRLLGYLNALLADYNDILKAEKVLDEEAIGLLYMIKTVIQPKDFDSYLKLISLSAKNEDYGTALFYLDELLVNGYANKETLYNLEHTALFRIMPEFNETVAKYLKEARYGIIEQ